MRRKSGKPVRFEWRRRNRDGSLHWDEVVLRTATIAGERRILAFTREVTERKLAEQAMRQAQKMEALGHLTGGIAHDFNNLLTSIMGYVVLASEHPAADTRTAACEVSRAGAASRAAARAISFSRCSRSAADSAAGRDPYRSGRSCASRSTSSRRRCLPRSS